MRVVVVGAGLAGLAAAEELTRAELEVVVVEARDRVGGRVWSTTTANGAVIEMGAEFVLPGHDVVRETCARLGLELADKRMFYGDREPRGVAIDAAQLHLGVGAVHAALEARGDHGEGVDAATFLDGLDLHPATRETIRSRAEVSCAATADRFPASALAHLAAISQEPCPTVRGGNQRIALGLAEGLDVRLGSAVERVAWGEGSVRVRAAEAELEADRVVLASPASVVGRIAFEPGLPPSLAAAYAGVSYGNAAKLFVPLRETPPPSAVLSVPERYWTWTADAGEGVQPVVHAFAGSAPALAALRVAEGPERWVESVLRLRPDLAIDPAGVVLSTWDDDPWVEAAYSCAAPPEEAWAPVGPIHVCGEHTAGPFHALM
ncbi:MAG: flavin monoamine oxidase family protein, partial [Gaiella sp.]